VAHGDPLLAGRTSKNSNPIPDFQAGEIGLDHGVGHRPRRLCQAQAPPHWRKEALEDSVAMPDYGNDSCNAPTHRVPPG
jgi:hypothetical protein